MFADFDWDERKAASNLRKHKVAFEDAIFAFYDEHAVIGADEHENEMRFRIVGTTPVGVLVVAFVERHGDVYRIISARRATIKERKQYEQGKAF